MRKDYQVTLLERDGSKRYCSLTESEVQKFDEITSILAKPELQSGMGLTKRRYFNLRDLAWETLIASGVNALPVRLEAIAAARGITLLSYEKQAAAVAIIDKLGIRQDRQGFSLEILGRGVVCFAEMENFGRQRFTVAHEIGHLVLRHVAATIENYEQEANMFARRILVPMGVLKACGVCSADEVATLCGISQEAAAYSFNRYTKLLARGKFYTNSLERTVTEQFKSFVCNYVAQK